MISTSACTESIESRIHSQCITLKFKHTYKHIIIMDLIIPTYRVVLQKNNIKTNLYQFMPLIKWNVNKVDLFIINNTLFGAKILVNNLNSACMSLNFTRTKSIGT